MPIPFTQYLRPHGRKVRVDITISPETDAYAADLINMGCLFMCEELTTGEVAIYCEDPTDSDNERTLSTKIVKNGPEIIEAVKELVKESYIAKMSIRDSQKMKCDCNCNCVLGFPHDINHCPLHAAAPDLLEACKAARDRISFCGNDQEDMYIFDELEKAIEKAEGKQ